MSSVFGQPAATQPAASSLFGGGTSNAATTPGQPTGASLFGATSTTTNTQRPALSLFGASTPNNAQASGNPATGNSLLGSNVTGSTQQTGSALFGGNNTTTQPGTTSIFGTNNTTNQPATSNLFGGNNSTNQTTTSSLFGGNAANNQQTGSALFGPNNNRTAQQGTSSLFGGSTTTNQPTGSSVFGANAMNNQAITGSLFNNNAAQPQPTSSLFQTSGTANNRPAMADRALSNTSALLQSGLSGSHFGALGQASQMDLAKSRLAQINFDTRTNEKSIPLRIQSIIRKWDPNSQETLLQDYTYNAVNAAYAPFYHKNDDETEKEWEDALARKPANIETKDGETVSFIPVLVRGFHALGLRAEVQARTVNEMRARLHEMNNSLTAVMTKHQQYITVQLEAVRRHHIVLAQRCLRLAVKVQVLRNRGYALDRAEEELRRTLQGLEKQVFDPTFAGREEEIWARMVALRERTRWLQEEGQRLGVQVAEENRKGIPEEIVNKTKKILRDYDGQLAHLSAELEDVKKEFTAWEEGQKALQR